MYTVVPASVVINSHMYLPTPGFTVTDEPSAPVTLVAFLTELGTVIAVTLAPTVANIITLPNLPDVGRLLKATVQLPVILAVGQLPFSLFKGHVPLATLPCAYNIADDSVVSIPYPMWS